MKLVILAGSGKIFGNGHAARMQDLQVLLHSAVEGQSRPGKLPLVRSPGPIGIGVDLFQVKDQSAAIEIAGSYGLAQKEPLLFLLDLQDMDPRPFSFRKRTMVLALDNRHPVREHLEGRRHTRIEFYDTLPHPRVSLERVLEQALISPLLLQWKEQNPVLPKDSRKAVFCAGSFTEVPDLFELFSDALCELKEGSSAELEEVLWLGSRPKDRRLIPLLSFGSRMPRKKFLQRLQEARLVFCYPGMTLLEAWFLGKGPILFSNESQRHNQLSAYLNASASLAYMNDTQKYSYKELLSCVQDAGSSLEPSGRGYELLIQKLRVLATGLA